ncbi:MAG: hypothetical protein SD837_10895 [Candidatus Electrothrix scaldis]|nr:MAG: hypothetical protein SD837_10895 [Candidatus Electrothrix sp. GW3-3]
MNEETSSLKKQLVDGLSSGTLLEAIRCIRLNNRADREALGQEIAALHNVGKIDAIAEFRKLNRSDQQHDFFMVRHVLEKALPLINAPVYAVMDCVTYLTEEAGGRIGHGVLSSSFIKFCEADTERPKKVLLAALDKVDDTFAFITSAIIAGSHFQVEEYAGKAVELCSHENLQVQCQAVHALRCIQYGNRKDLTGESLLGIQKAVEKRCDENLFSAALRAVFALYKVDESKEECVVEIMQYILQQLSDTVLYAASELLFLEAKILPVSMIDLLLQALLETNAEHHEAIRDIDSGLCSLWQRGMQESVISFLEEILVQEQHEFSVKQFNELIWEIAENKERSLDILITRWLLSKQVALGRAAADLLEASPDDGIAVAADLDQLQELPEGIRVFLARKACGWFFHKQISAASFIVSLIDTASDDELEEINEILFHPLLISYSGSVKDYLIKVVGEEPSEKVKLVIDTVLERLNIYHESLESPVDELVPTQVQRETHLRYMNRLMAESYKEARKNSIVEQIATKFCLLYGSRSIHRFENEFVSQNARQEIPMQKMRHSFEIPALEYLDPHELNYKLLIFRAEGCGS